MWYYTQLCILSKNVIVSQKNVWPKSHQIYCGKLRRRATTTGILVYTSSPMCHRPHSGQTSPIHTTPPEGSGKDPTFFSTQHSRQPPAKHPGPQAKCPCPPQTLLIWQFADQLFPNFTGYESNIENLKAIEPSASTTQLAIYSGGAEEDFNILQFVQCQTVYNNSFDVVSEQADWGKAKGTVPKLASFTPVWVREKEPIVDNITNITYGGPACPPLSKSHSFPGYLRQSLTTKQINSSLNVLFSGYWLYSTRKPNRPVLLLCSVPWMKRRMCSLNAFPSQVNGTGRKEGLCERSEWNALF